MIIKISSLFIKDELVKKVANFFYQACLILSLILTAVSLYLGDVAAEVVRSKICQMSRIDQHEELGKILLIALASLLAAEIINMILKESTKTVFLKRLAVIHGFVLAILFSLTGVSLFRAAHSGAALVYVQGAAVLNHPKNCP